MYSFDLRSLITENDLLRAELGFSRFSYLAPWCDQPSPLTADEDGLEQFCIVREGR